MLKGNSRINRTRNSELGRKEGFFCEGILEYVGLEKNNIHPVLYEVSMIITVNIPVHPDNGFL